MCSARCCIQKCSNWQTKCGHNARQTSLQVSSPRSWSLAFSSLYAPQNMLINVHSILTASNNDHHPQPSEAIPQRWEEGLGCASFFFFFAFTNPAQARSRRALYGPRISGKHQKGKRSGFLCSPPTFPDKLMMQAAGGNLDVNLSRWCSWLRFTDRRAARWPGGAELINNSFSAAILSLGVVSVEKYGAFGDFIRVTSSRTG